MTNPQLSIIIPCYNCADTLREAVESCYVQGLNENEFEIIMVDDGSKDTTRELMAVLAAEHPNIKLLFHEKNRGGGAARNTGIQAAEGEIIYCLDSDNVFAPNSVRPMLEFLEKTGVDGVAFYERRFFVGNNKKKYSTHLNPITDRSIELFDIYNGSGTLLDNFFYTKTAYEKTLGYPEHHGFDTQCFEVRFLSAGNSVRVCHNSFFWHRQAGGHKSYFERAYESGNYSLNMYYILEEILHLLSPEAQKLVINFDVFGNSKLGNNNLLGTLVEKFKYDEYNLFKKDYRDYLLPEGKNIYHTKYRENDMLANAVWLMGAGHYEIAGQAFLKVLRDHQTSLLLQFNLLRCAAGIQGTAPAHLGQTAMATAKKFNLKQQKIDLDPNMFKRIAYWIKNKLR